MDEFIDVLLKMNTKQKMENFLQGILTPKELEEVPMRLQIIKMLKSDMTQHEIAEKLGIGVATVSRGSKEIQKGNFKYVKQ